MSDPSQRKDDALESIKSLLESGVDAAVLLDSERRIVYFNNAYQSISGRRGRSLQLALERGQKCYEVFPLEICKTACLGCRARDLGKPLRVDEIKALRRSGGEELTLIVSAAPLPGGYIVETYRDVTADVRIQRKYKVLLDHERRAKEILEKTVQSRTDELRQANEELKRTQGQLIHQEKMSSLGRLVAGIAHELNNPINFIYGNVDFLSKYVEDLVDLVSVYDRATAGLADEARAIVEEKKNAVELDFLVDDLKKLIMSIRAGAERTAGIVRDLKAFSRTAGGEPQAFDLVRGIETTLNLIVPLLKNRIDVHREFEADLPSVVCHPGHVNQVFMNILTNAAQAITGEGEIHVSARKVRRANVDMVEVRVRDTGPGIRPEYLEKVFDPFFTTKEVGEGTGLGLSISESIVRNHGGVLRVESPPGQGATFIVELPIHAEQAVAPMAVPGRRM